VTFEAARDLCEHSPADGASEAARAHRKILVVEDDAATAAFLKSGLGANGYRVECAGDGATGLTAARHGDFDAIILDRMLPNMDGLALLRALRDQGADTPVIFLSAIGSTDERVRGLHAGSDDYLVKPFAMSELLARLEVSQRRRATAAAVVTRLVCADLTLDLLGSRAERAGQALLLQPRALQLLEFLMRNSGQVVTRSMIFQKVWNYDFDPGTNVIDVYVSNLRREIDRPGLVPLLHTVRGAGYRLGSGA
jgi:two-component system OmpR family response regulator